MKLQTDWDILENLQGMNCQFLREYLQFSDIFEALTSVDRPYKKDKTLSEVVEIMYKMKESRHVDPDILICFLDQEFILSLEKNI